MLGQTNQHWAEPAFGLFHVRRTMHYILQALDWLQPLALAFGAVVGFWAFRRSRKVGYLVVAIYFCLAVFSQLALPRIKAELNARRTPTLSEQTERKIDAAVSEAIDRVMREEGVPFRTVAFNHRINFGPLVLVLGVWLLARREPRVEKPDAASDTPKYEHTSA